MQLASQVSKFHLWTLQSKSNIRYSIHFHAFEVVFTKKNTLFLRDNIILTEYFLFRHFRYSSQDAVGDMVAGITVGLTVIPQALAYAGIAGLDPAYGLYGSFMGCFVYILLGSCKDVPMGPTAIASLLTYQAAGGVWQKAVLLVS